MPDTAVSPPAFAADLESTPVQDESGKLLSARLSSEQILPPGQVPGYEIDRQLGAGSYGTVWLARELKTGKQVAIKFYTQRRGLNWSLLSREVEKLALLYTSRDVVRLLDVGWDHDPPYFVMEYLEQGSLETRLRDGPLPVDEAARFAEVLARALQHAHRSGILHCDLKPANVLLDANAEPRLGDFGQSRLTTEQSPALGTVFYMAPEQAQIDAVPDVRWDVYALGAVLYCMLTGSPPYSTPQAEGRLQDARPLSRRLEMYREIVAKSPPPELHHTIPGVDHRLAELVAGCLERDPALRIPNLQAVLDKLQAREQARAKRPLIALGFLGPIVFLTAMYWIAESVVPRIVAAAEENLINRALGSDVVTAQVLAESVLQEVQAREDALEQMASRPQMQQLIEESRTLSDQELLARCRDEGGEASSGGIQPESLCRWLNAQVRTITQQLVEDGRTADDSWFVTDDTGRQIYRYPAFEEGHESTIGRLFHWRDYYHGQGVEYDENAPIGSFPIRTTLGVSAPFRSQASGQYMVALTTPIRDAAGLQIIGLMSRTIRLTALLQRWESRIAEEDKYRDPENGTLLRFLALGDARGERLRLLDHPGMTQAHLTELDDVVLQSSASPLAVAPQFAECLTRRNRCDRYLDPIAAIEPQFQGEWLAAAAPVGSTGWLAIVQERRDSAVAPVDNLRRLIVNAGLWSIGIFSGLLMLLWLLIRRVSA